MRDPQCLGTRRLRAIARHVGSDVLARALAGLERRSRLAWLAALPGGFRAMVEDEVRLLRETLTADEFAAATSSARGLVMSAAFELAESTGAPGGLFDDPAGATGSTSSPGRTWSDDSEPLAMAGAGLPSGSARGTVVSGLGPPTGVEPPLPGAGQGQSTTGVPLVRSKGLAMDTGRGLSLNGEPSAVRVLRSGAVVAVASPSAAACLDATVEGWEVTGASAPTAARRGLNDWVTWADATPSTDPATGPDPAPTPDRTTTPDAGRPDADLLAALASTDDDALLWQAQTRVGLSQHPLSRCALPQLAEVFVGWARLAYEDPLLLDDLLPLVDDGYVQVALRLVSSPTAPDLVQAVLDRQQCAALVETRQRQAITIEGLRSLDDRDHPAVVRDRLQGLSGLGMSAALPAGPVSHNHLQRRRIGSTTGSTQDCVDLFAAMAQRLRREPPATHWDRRLLTGEPARADIVPGRVGRYVPMAAMVTDTAGPLLRQGLAQLAAATEPAQDDSNAAAPSAC
jgi:hypothetical protein